MSVILQFATLFVATGFAVGAAVLLDWMMLKAAFRLMRLAGRVKADRGRAELVSGTVLLVRAYGA